MRPPGTQPGRHSSYLSWQHPSALLDHPPIPSLARGPDQTREEQPVNAFEPDEPADEVDPTGVRAMLAALPDPGPMPETVAARIRASLSAEQAAAGSAAVQDSEQSETLASGDQSGVVDLTPRRRTRHLLAAAAAVAGVALVGGVVAGQLGDDSGPWDSVAAIYNDMGSQDESADAGAAATEESAEEMAPSSNEGTLELLSEGEDSSGSEDGSATTGLDPEKDRSAEPLAVTGTVRPLTGVTDLTTDTFAVGVGSALDQGTESSEGMTSATDAAAGCVEATGSDLQEASWAVGPGTLDGDPVAVVVRVDSAVTGPAMAWALTPECLGSSDTSTELLLGPAQLP